MSRTVRDLIEAFQVDEQRSFDPGAVWQGSLRRAQQRRLRRRSAVALAAGVAAMAAVAAPTALFPAGSPSLDPAQPGQLSTTAASPAGPTAVSSVEPAARPPLSTTLRAVASDRWVVLPASTDARLQLAYVRRAGETKMSGSIEVYEPGVFDPSLLLDGTQTTVDGQPAYFAWVPDPFHTSGEVRRALAWSYAPDAWVVVRIEHDTPDPTRSAQIPAELLEIASLVEIGEPEPVRLPFRVGYRPATLAPAYVLHFEAAWLNRVVWYDFVGDRSDHRQREASLPLRIGMQPAVPGYWRPNTTIAGQPAMYDGATATFAVGEQWVEIGSGVEAEPLAIEEIERIFTHLTFADWHDPSTWFDANTAA